MKTFTPVAAIAVAAFAIAAGLAAPVAAQTSAAATPAGDAATAAPTAAKAVRIETDAVRMHPAKSVKGGAINVITRADAQKHQSREVVIVSRRR